MSSGLKLQRLVYPYREPNIKQSEFGPSTHKFKATQDFFACSAVDRPQFANGEIQRRLEHFYSNRKKIVGHAMDVHFQFTEASIDHTRTLYVLGQKEKLEAFEHSLIVVSKKLQDSNPPNLSGLREFIIADFLSASKKASTEEQQTILHNTMGWLDLESGCFVMRSRQGLNRVRELFGMRPHVAMRKQRHNYPALDLEPPPQPE